MDLSVIVPTFNEGPNVAELVRRIDAALEGRAFEIVFVDDYQMAFDALRERRVEGFLADELLLLAFAQRSGAPQDNALLSGKTAALMGAGGGMGTSRSQYHLRQVCVFLNLHLLNRPEVFSNAFTEAFDTEGNLTDTRIAALIGDQMQALTDWTRRIKG